MPQTSLVRNIKLTLSYDGTDFNGWQTQPGYRTVQETLEERHRRADRRDARPRQRQRPDRRRRPRRRPGRQLLHGDATIRRDVFVKALNARLPARRGGPRRPRGAAGVRRQPRRRAQALPLRHPRRRRCRTCSCAATATTSATGSTRRRWPGGRVPARPARLPQLRDRVAQPAAAACARSRTSRVNRIGDCIWLDVEADGFLYNMVRAIAGTLINVGRGLLARDRRSPTILQPRTAREAGPTAPPQGLFLMRVTLSSRRMSDAANIPTAADRAAERRRAPCVPGSKSITNRALRPRARSTAGDQCALHGRSAQRRHRGDDRPPCGRWAIVVEPDWDETRAGHHDDPRSNRRRARPGRRADLFVANSGTTMRFLTALVSLGQGRYRLDGVAADARAAHRRPARRPAPARRRRAQRERQRLPAGRGRGRRPARRAGRVRGDVSSQFLSGLLMAAPFARSRRRHSRSRRRSSRGPTST